MVRPIKRNRFRFALRLETLERREVFAADAVSLIAIDPPAVSDMLTDQIYMDPDPLRTYVINRSYAPATPSDTLDTFSDRNALDAKLTELAGKYWEGVLEKTPSEISTPLWNYGGYWPIAVAGDAIWLSAARATTQASVPTSAFDQLTNTRHAGVDEADLVDATSDGYLYAIIGNDLQIVNLQDPSDIKVTKDLSVGGRPTQLFTVGNSLVLVQSDYGTTPSSIWANSSLMTSQLLKTRVAVYDISERTVPTFKSEIMLDGSNLTARLMDGQLTFVQYNSISLPLPKLVQGVDGVSRYESLDSYMAANRDELLSAILPDYTDASGSSDLGSWDDVSIANDLLTISTTVVRVGVANNELTLLDSETIVGAGASLVYQGLEDIYLVVPGAWADAEFKSYIYKIDVQAEGQLDAIGVVEIRGMVNDAFWLNEHNGVLQVASSARKLTTVAPNTDPQIDPTWIIPLATVSANITTVGNTENGWGILGTLEDIAEGQALLGANFVGDQAVLTTGNAMIDPLHVIDLSDPTQPIELSELTIPGFTTYLEQVDATHWLGLGFANDNMLERVLQVSLYDVSDLANPRVVDTWTATDLNQFGRWDAHSISFDATTGYLTMSSGLYSVNGQLVKVPVLKVDADAADPLTLVGRVGINDYLQRGLLIGDVYVALGSHRIVTYNIGDLENALDTVYLENYEELSYNYWFTYVGYPSEWEVGPNWGGEPFKVVSVDTTGPIAVSIIGDRRIRLDAAAASDTQDVTVTLLFESGKTLAVKSRLYAYASNVVNYGESRAQISARFTDENGNAVEEPREGDEVWVTVSAADTSSVPQGVFGIYVDVNFETSNVTVLGDPVHLGEFTNGVKGEVVESGIKLLGGFAGTSPSAINADIARFKIRVENDWPISMTFSPAKTDQPGYETLLYGRSIALGSDYVSTGLLTTQGGLGGVTLRSAIVVNSSNQNQDVNGDGVITPLDVLQVVNYINDRSAQSSESQSSESQSIAFSRLSEAGSPLDVSGDGVISPLDVLQIVNTINDRYSSPASGEATSLNSAAVDQLLAVDLDTLKRK